MIKIKTEMVDDVFKIDQEYKNTNTVEALLLISKLVDEILKNNVEIKEKEIIKFIKNRKKYMEEN